MSDIAIRVENLSKQYILGANRSSDGLRHVVQDLVSAPLRWLKRSGSAPQAGAPEVGRSRKTSEPFWALRDVSFDIKQGEVLGIIGRNGAGKSTLLKILSRITEQTTGRVEINGRVSSLLEVGTGFHPELTGRENIFLNGAILGMRRQEIKKRFDEIVAFAEVEKFLDTPVKRYSSGMYVRLAFAVAAHLEPEILIVDEVLAVGDAQFQKKCLGKMKDVSNRQGRTVLFVSHNMRAVEALCTQVLYLASGTVKSCGPVTEQLNDYFKDVNAHEALLGNKPVNAGSLVQIHSLKFNPNPCKSGAPLDFELGLKCNDRVCISNIAILIYSKNETRVAVVDLQRRPNDLTTGSYNFSGSIKALQLVAGEYRVGLYIKTTDFVDNLLDLAKLLVTDQVHEDGYVPYDAAHRGFVELEYEMGDTIEASNGLKKLFPRT